MPITTRAKQNPESLEQIASELDGLSDSLRITKADMERSQIADIEVGSYSSVLIIGGVAAWEIMRSPPSPRPQPQRTASTNRPEHTVIDWKDGGIGQAILKVEVPDDLLSETHIARVHAFHSSRMKSRYPGGVCINFYDTDGTYCYVIDESGSLTAVTHERP